MKQEQSHLTKALRKNFSDKKKNQDYIKENLKPHSEPYKKPKTNFRNFVEDHLFDDDDDDDFD